MNPSQGYWLERQRARLKEAVTWDDWGSASELAQQILERLPSDSYATIVLEQSDGKSQVNLGSDNNRSWHDNAKTRIGFVGIIVVVVTVSVIAAIAIDSGSQKKVVDSGDEIASANIEVQSTSPIVHLPAPTPTATVLADAIAAMSPPVPTPISASPTPQISPPVPTPISASPTPQISPTVTGLPTTVPTQTIPPTATKIAQPSPTAGAREAQPNLVPGLVFTDEITFIPLDYVFQPQTIVWANEADKEKSLTTIDAGFRFKNTLYSPHDLSVGEWSWGFKISDGETTKLDILLYSGGGYKVSGTEVVTSSAATGNNLGTYKNLANYLEIIGLDKIVKIIVNGKVVGVIETNGRLDGEVSIYRDVFEFETRPGFLMRNEEVSVTNIQVVQNQNFRLGPLINTELTRRIETQNLVHLSATISNPFKNSSNPVDTGLRIGYATSELESVWSILKTVDGIQTVLVTQRNPIKLVYSSTLSAIELTDHDADEFKISLFAYVDAFLLTVDDATIQFERDPRFGAIKYIEFFANGTQSAIDDNSGYFSSNPYLNLTNLNIWLN
jgi:hypothetical protein